MHIHVRIKMLLEPGNQHLLKTLQRAIIHNAAILTYTKVFIYTHIKGLMKFQY